MVEIHRDFIRSAAHGVTEFVRFRNSSTHPGFARTEINDLNLQPSGEDIHHIPYGQNA